MKAGLVGMDLVDAAMAASLIRLTPVQKYPWLGMAAKGALGES
jgi:hypothetical protein